MDLVHILAFQTLKFWKSLRQSNNTTLHSTFMYFSKERDYTVLLRTYSCNTTDSVCILKYNVLEHIPVSFCSAREITDFFGIVTCCLLCAYVFFGRHGEIRVIIMHRYLLRSHRRHVIGYRAARVVSVRLRSVNFSVRFCCVTFPIICQNVIFIGYTAGQIRRECIPCFLLMTCNKLQRANETVHYSKTSVTSRVCR